MACSRANFTFNLQRCYRNVFVFETAEVYFEVRTEFFEICEIILVFPSAIMFWYLKIKHYGLRNYLPRVKFNDIDDILF